MNAQPTFAIDLSEDFPHLDRAPIVEAVIHWSARSEKTLRPEELQDHLKMRLPDYPNVQTQQELQLEAQIAPGSTAQSQHTQWHGFRLESADQRYIAQFTRNGFVFSRIRPYEDWSRFTEEAKRLWRLHVELAEPSEIERLGVRFINRLVPVEMDKLDEILTLPTRCPPSLTLPIGEFLHRSRFAVPGHPYSLNVIQTTQPPAPPDTDALGLILDIDVITTKTTDLDESALDARLSEMRWLKNKAFYSLLTEQTIERLRERQS